MVTTIDAGRQETVEVRQNLELNPRMAVDASGWSYRGGGGNTGTLARISGGNVGGFSTYLRAQVTTAGTWFRISSTTDVPVIPGKAYTLSGWMNRVGTVQSGALFIGWRLPEGIYVESTYRIPEVSGASVRYSFTAIAPEGAISARREFGLSGGAVGNHFNLTGVLFEQTDTLGSYFDGSTTDAPPVAYDWTGPANASASVQMITRQVVVRPRLVDGFTASREIRTVVHPVLNSESADVSLRAPGLRSGEFRMLVESQEDALYAFSVLAVPQVFTMSDPQVPAVEMLFVAAPGDLRLELDDATRKVWWVVVPFQEVES